MLFESPFHHKVKDAFSECVSAMEPKLASLIHDDLLMAFEVAFDDDPDTRAEPHAVYFAHICTGLGGIAGREQRINSIRL